jgi:hypothetical protein
VHDEIQTRILPIHSTKIDSSAILSSAKKTAAMPNRSVRRNAIIVSVQVLYLQELKQKREAKCAVRTKVNPWYNNKKN